MINILAIETSADETAAAVTQGRKVLSNVIFSQIATHRKWGGIYPALAKRAHEERIDSIVEGAMRGREFSSIGAIAVTYGPGLAVALEVGIKKAKELARQHNKKIIPVNHLEGHIYSGFVQNRNGNPEREFGFPYLAYILSGGHTELVLFKNHVQYEIIGKTRDDAAGEALDKAAKMLGLGYPGGPVIEKLGMEAGHSDEYHFPRPMIKSAALDFSFSGLKTSFYYFVKQLSEHEKASKIKKLCSAFQEAVFDTLEAKLETAIQKTGIKSVIVGGGVSANHYLRLRFRRLLRRYAGQVKFPPYPYLSGDNAAMIGVAGYFKYLNNMLLTDVEKLDRVPRLRLDESYF